MLVVPSMSCDAETDVLGDVVYVAQNCQQVIAVLHVVSRP